MKTSCLSALALSLLIAGAQAATVNFVQTSRNDVDGSILAAVSSDTYNLTGSFYATLPAPSTYGGFRFTHWTNSSSPAVVYRDAWGRSLDMISFILLEATTATAHYRPSNSDGDGDGVPDWYEIQYHGHLENRATADTDADGFTLLQEFQNGSHVLFPNARLAGGVSCEDSGLVTVNLAGYSHYALRSVPAGIVNQSGTVVTGTVVTTPNLIENKEFGYWALDGMRQQDTWGRAFPKISFVIGTENREAVAYLFPGDTDGDRVPDAFEQAYFGTLANPAASDTDGDGVTLLAEFAAGTNPRYTDAHQEGGVASAQSQLVTVNSAGFSRYSITSAPEGFVNESTVVPDGSTITVPEMMGATFGYWALDGVRLQNAWGVAVRQFSFTVNNVDRTAVAHLFAGDSDGDGINDGFEQFYFGTLVNGATSDTDGDGVLLMAEFSGGSNPVYGNLRQEGGVAWADSGIVVVNLQQYERLGKALIGGVLTDFFSPNQDNVTGIQAGTWSATAVTDWDGDGDLDLFVAHEGGLRVFRNIGTARNPNFEEITSGFAALVAYVTATDRPVLTGGDWNGDGLGDLIIGGNTSTLRLVASGSTFNSNASGANLAVESAKARPALGDMNGDGKADLLVLLADGTVRLYLNNGLAVPFAGPGTENFLGVSAPAGTSIATGDINQDGLPDVLLADTDGRIWEFFKTGGNSFTLQSKVWGGSHAGFATGLTLAAADLEGDGDLDLIGGLANGGVIALRDPGVGRPTGLIATPGANSIRLDWDANWQSRIRGYYIYRSHAAAGPFGKLIPEYVPLPSYLDTAVNPAELNHYYVSGVSYFFLPGNSEPRVVESLPSDPASTAAGKVILAMRPVHGNPGQTVKIKLSIENATGVSGVGMQIRVAYDLGKLQPLAQAHTGEKTVLFTGLSKNLTVSDNGVVAAGELVIDGSAGSMEPGSGKVFTLQFKVAANVPHGSVLGATITRATMSDLDGNALAVGIQPEDQPESGDAFTDGDLDGDGAVTNADKTLLKDLIKPTSRQSTADESIAGDLNGDGKLDEKDLVLLMRLLSGLSLDNPP